MARSSRPAELRAVCDPATLRFRSTAELPALDGMIGQERAVAATSFGIAMRRAGYNLFVPAASTRRSRASSTSARRAASPGRQGVIIPKGNVRHLMLREDVVEAVRAGTFHVHAIATVDEDLALLSGRDAGAPGRDGRFPEGTFNAAVGVRWRPAPPV